MNAQITTVSNADGKVEMQYSRKPPWLVLPTLTLVWLGMVGIGLAWMWEYETTPGEFTTSLTHWPAESRIERNTDRPTLVIFAHPRCPCTRATISELALIMAHCPERVDVRVLFFKPSGFSTGWEKTDLWSSAEAIPGVTVISDEDGSEAKIFRATTSGLSLLYDPNGRLLFDGGITVSRGHSGDNAGRSAIESLLMNGQSDQKQQTFVFGCPLLGQEDACGMECQQ
jgi:hypothetical protein